MMKGNTKTPIKPLCYQLIFCPRLQNQGVITSTISKTGSSFVVLSIQLFYPRLDFKYISSHTLVYSTAIDSPYYVTNGNSSQIKPN